MKRSRAKSVGTLLLSLLLMANTPLAALQANAESPVPEAATNEENVDASLAEISQADAEAVEAELPEEEFELDLEDGEDFFIGIEEETEAEVVTEAEPEVEIETEAEPEPVTEVEIETEAEPETEVEVETAAEAETEVESETEAEVELETEAVTSEEEAGTVWEEETKPQSEEIELSEVSVLAQAFTEEELAKIKDVAIPLNLQEETICNIQQGGQIVYYSFTPETTENYWFYSSSDYDTYAMLYDLNYNNRYDFDNGGEGSNFKAERKLYKGYTYYFAVKLYLNTATGNFPVKLESNQFQISTSETDVKVNPGEGAVLEVNVSATDTSKSTYQWMDTNYKPIEGATGSRYDTPGIEEYTVYRCYVQDGYGNSQYVYFSISVDNNLNVTIEQSDLSVKYGETTTLSVAVTATNTEEISYAWSDKNGIIEGALSATYTVPPVTERKYYRCTVTDRYGNTQTVFFYVRVDNAFGAQAVKESQQVEPGQSVTLEVKVTGTDLSKVTYEWRDEQYNHIEGATANAFVIPIVKKNARYECIVNDGYGFSSYVSFYVSVENNLSVATEQM